MSYRSCNFMIFDCTNCKKKTTSQQSSQIHRIDDQPIHRIQDQFTGFKIISEIFPVFLIFSRSLLEGMSSYTSACSIPTFTVSCH